MLPRPLLAITALTDHFLAVFRASRRDRKQAAFVLNELLKAHSVAPDGSRAGQDSQSGAWRASALAVQEEYLSDAWMALATSNSPSPEQLDLRVDAPPTASSAAAGSSMLALSDLHHNIILTTLLLEGVGVMVGIFGAGSVGFLEQSLYWLLMSLGSPTAAVAHSALHSLGRTAVACGYGTLTELIGDNADYLINTISLNLQYLSLNPHAPLVVRVMLQYAGHATYPVFLDLAEDLFDVLDGCSGAQAEAYIGVLSALLGAMLRWKPHLLPGDPESLGGDAGPNVPTGVDAPSAPPEDDSQESAQDATTPRPGQQEEQVAQPVQFVVDILARCRHDLSSPGLKHRLLVLQAIKQGVCFLKDHERQLLPAVHDLWQPILPALADASAPVAISALDLVEQVSVACGDFLRQRVVKDVMSVLAARLLSVLHEVKQEGAGLRGRSSAYKLAVASLSSFGRLAAPIQLRGAELEDVARAVMPFVHPDVPDELRDLAAALLRDLAGLDPDLLWFCLANACASAPPLASPATRLTPVVWPARPPKELVGCGPALAALLGHIEVQSG